MWLGLGKYLGCLVRVTHKISSVVFICVWPSTQTVWEWRPRFYFAGTLKPCVIILLAKRYLLCLNAPTRSSENVAFGRAQQEYWLLENWVVHRPFKTSTSQHEVIHHNANAMLSSSNNIHANLSCRLQHKWTLTCRIMHWTTADVAKWCWPSRGTLLFFSN